MDPGTASLVGAGINVLGGLFGGGGGGSSNLEGLYKRYQEILDEGMRLYRTTDLDELFRQSQEAYRRVMDQYVQSATSNYNSRLLAGGVTPTGNDTEQAVQRGLVRKKAATEMAGREASFLMSKPMLQKSLLPGVGDATAGMGMAGSLDQAAGARKAANRNVIGGLGDLVADILAKEKERETPYKPDGTYNPWWK